MDTESKNALIKMAFIGLIAAYWIWVFWDHFNEWARLTSPNEPSPNGNGGHKVEIPVSDEVRERMEQT
jgi:hypothetical protein